MKKIFTFCTSVKNWINVSVQLLMLALLMNGNVWGQTEKIIGTGTSTYRNAPIARYWNYSASEIIYLGSEIDLYGTIEKIAFQKGSGTSGTSINNVSIYMKTTTNSVVSSPASTSGYQLVWSGSFPNSGTSGWQEITLSTPFVYSENNLSVLVIKGHENWTSNDPYYRYTTTTGQNRTSYYNNDSNPWGSGSSSMTLSTNRPNIRFSITPPPCSGTPNPGNTIASAGTVCHGSTVNLSLQNTTLGSGVTYQWQSSSNGSSWTNITGATSSTLTSSAINSNTYFRCAVTCGGNTGFSNSTMVSIFTDGNEYGVDSWIGHVYYTHNGGNPPSNAFTTTYRGIITENEIFNRNWGTSGPTPSCGSITSNSFAVRFRMTKNYPAGNYRITIGGDDGVRLSVDGGANFVINDWINHGYRTTSADVYLDGQTNLVLEYFENTGDARVSFDICQIPANESCANATTLTIDAPASTGTLNCATFESPFPSKRDVWYKFTPSCSGSHTVTLSGLSDDKDLYLYSGNCGSLTQIGLSTSGGSSNENITTSLNAGTTYHIAVFDYANTGGSFNIGVTSSIAAPSQPSEISGTLDPEPGNSETYSVTNVAGVAYAWTFPSGWVINSGQGSNSVTVTVGSTNGTISVTPSSCGINGTARTATTTIPNYRARFVSADYGSSDWCTGETRTVGVAVKNTGINTWTNSSPDINIGVKWNTNGALWHDFHSRTDANNLAPGETRTYNLTISAKDATAGPTYSNNLASGINNLSFSVVYEGSFWFNYDSGTFGSVTLGNTPTYTSGAINIKPVPTSVDAGIGGEICYGQNLELSGSATSPSNSILHKASDLSDFQEFGTNDTDRWAIFSSADAGGSSPELGFQYFDGSDGTMISAWAAGPVINATNFTTLNVSFKHTVDRWTGTVPLFFQTTTDGVNWTTKWNLNATSDVGPETVSINLDDLAGTVFSYRFLFDGNIWNLDYWFIDDIIVSGTPTLTYSWTPSATLTNSNTSTPVASPGSTTTYTFTATANSCSASDEVTVTVNQLPTTVVNERCLNGSRGVEITGSGGSGVYTEYQQLGNSVQATNFYTVNLGGSASFLIKDNKGCWSQPVFYQAPPAPTVISNSGSSGQCILRGIDTWSHVLDADNKVIVSILDGGNDIGWINANVTVEPTTQNFQSTAYLKRNYDISVQAQPSSNVTLRLYFTEDEYNELVTESFNNNNNQDNVYSIEHLKVTKYQGPNVNNNYADNDFDCVPCFAVLTPIAHGEEFGSKYIDIQIGGFSEFWVHGGTGNDSWLPVELLSFDAKCDNGNALIEWATATETNNNFFSVQKSLDGVNFQTIGRVNGAGNNNGYLSYKFLDSQKSNDRVYYRLTQTDYDGTVTIYNPKSLNCISSTTIIKAVPNPFSDNLVITSNISDLCLIEIMSSNGKKVYAEKKSIQGSINIDLSHLSPGMYFLNITEVSGKQHHIKLVKK